MRCAFSTLNSALGGVLPALAAAGRFSCPGGLFRRFWRRRPLSAPARTLERLPEPLHQVHHLAVPRLISSLEVSLGALHLGLDDLHQVGAVFVRVLRGVPGVGEILDERARHLQFGLAYVLSAREAELTGI